MSKTQGKTKAEETQTDDKGDNKQKVKEIGGFEDQNLPEPTRYGDWEVGGRCSDF